jgi:hypothetical protein
VFAISYDPIGAIAQFADEHSIEYDFLADEGSAFIKQLGILNTLVDPDETVYGIPYPGTYVLDEQGIVVQKYFHREYQIREAASFVLEEAFGLPVALDEHPGDSAAIEDVRISARLGAPDLKFRQRVDLHVRIDLPEGLHVGGPQVTESYIATEVTVTGPEGLSIGAPRYPATVPFQVEGLGVPIPVLEGDTVIRVELISGLREMETAPVDVEVRYQACNDRECFLPQAAKLHLELPLGTLNRAARRT